MRLLLVLVFLTVVKGDGGQYFRVRPRNSSVLEGGEVTIPCEVGNRVGIVQWVKDGFAYVVTQTGEIVGHPRLRLIGDQNAGIYNLKITDASLNDDGEYQCQVGPYLRIKPIRANARLTVISPPQRVEITSPPARNKLEVKVGESKKLECSVRSAKPAASIIWYRGNVQIKGGESGVTAVSIEGDKEMLKPGEISKELLKYDTHGSITIVPTADDNEMNYTCEANHPAIPIDMPMRATVKLSVFYPPGMPYIEGYTEGETVKRGQQLELTCKSRGGNPPAQIAWFRNTEQVSTVYRSEGTYSESVLSIIAKAQDNNARYRCEVSNIMSVEPMKVHVDLTVLFAPASASITGPATALPNSTVSVSCAAQPSNPPSEIKWTVDGQAVDSNASKTEPAEGGGWITTSNVTFKVGGGRNVVVICDAVNARLTENVIRTHTISVIYPPSRISITGYEEGTTIDAGTVLSLMCTAISGNPLATLTWYKNDKKVPGTTRTRDHAVSSELTILVNASDNNARIRCEATNAATEIPLLKVLTLKINFPPDKVKINRDPPDFHASSKGLLTCESSSSNPAAEMSWWLSGIPVAGTRNGTRPGLHGGYVAFVELELELTEEMNGEVYMCQAKNVEMERTVHDATTLDVLYKPVFAPPDPAPSGQEGEPFVLSVSATGNPGDIRYSWTRDGLPLAGSGRRISVRGGTLNITKLDRKDAGTYVVEASNEEGNGFLLVNITVQYPATIKHTSPPGIIYPPGVEAKLFCEVDGSPMGDEYITWQKLDSNSELSGRYSTSFVNRTSYLHIEEPDERDVGEYVCRVNNGIGNVSSAPILFITNFKPQMMNTPLTRKAAANKGINVQLFCKARGSPLPRFTWTFNGKTLLPNATEHKYSITHTDLTELTSESTLTILRVTGHDYGKYECRASNKLGFSTDLIDLDITSPPDKPSDLFVFNVTHDSVRLHWKPGFDGGLPTSYQIRWREALDYENRYRYMDVGPRETSATIGGLALGTYYVFSVKAVNEKGDSGYLPDLVKVQTLREAPPVPSPAPSTIIIIIVSIIMACCLLAAAIFLGTRKRGPREVQRETQRDEGYAYVLLGTAMLFVAGNILGGGVWYILKRRRDRINKSQTADMYAPSTVNGDTMTGELSSVSDEKSDANFDGDYVDEGRKTAASTYLIDQIQDFSKGGLEMQVHQGTLRRSTAQPRNLDSPPQRTTASGTLSVSKSSYIGNPSPAPPADTLQDSLFLYEPPTLESYYPAPTDYYPTHTNTLTRRLRPVPPPDVTVMAAKNAPSVPPPPRTNYSQNQGQGYGTQLSTFTSTQYSDIDGHLV